MKIAALLACQILGQPGLVQAQAVDGDWEVRVILDGSRHETRRVRSLFFRETGGPLEAPALGPRVLDFLHDRGVVGQWPGFGVVSPPAPVSEVARIPERTGRGLQGTDELKGVPLKRTELPLARGTEWRLTDAESPLWTVVFREQGDTVFSLASPFRLPLLPERVAVRNQNVLWALHHRSNGQVDWALAIGLVGGSTSAYWEALWRADRDAGPQDLEAALDLAPWGLMRHVRDAYREREPWGPLGALKASLSSVRYNLVEGGSVEIPFWLNVTPAVELRAWARPSTTSYPLDGGVGVTWDRWPAQWGVQAYRRLLDANRWEPAESSKGNSFSALLHGRDNGHYFTAEGVSLWGERQHGNTTWRVELFAESDRAALPRTDYSLLPMDSTDVPLGLDAEDGDYYGLRGVLEHQRGLRTDQGVLLARMWYDAAGGDRSFLRLGGAFDALRTWGWWAVGARVAGGGVVGDAPVQREFFLGGLTTIRGYDPATEEGPIIAFSRMELGFGPPAFRLVAFGDAGWAGESGSIEHLSAVGFGISLAEGAFRLDFAKPVSGGSGLRVYLTGNGLI